ncbi:hypothetical protein MHYP_G00147070 [Metynnis hypsauchen]
MDDAVPTEGQKNTSATDVEQLAASVQLFLIQQQERDEAWRKEAAKQETRWRSLQHQFTLLQQMVQDERSERMRPAGGVEAGLEHNPSQILRHSREARAATDIQSSSPWRHSTPRPTPRLPELKESDDIEHYLTMFERIAQTAGWPPEDWAIHLIPALEGKAREAYIAMDANDIGDYKKGTSSEFRAVLTSLRDLSPVTSGPLTHTLPQP